VIDVLLQEYIVVRLFGKTMLPFCPAANPVPVITIWFPIDPVAANSGNCRCRIRGDALRPDELDFVVHSYGLFFNLVVQSRPTSMPSRRRKVKIKIRPLHDVLMIGFGFILGTAVVIAARSRSSYELASQQAYVQQVRIDGLQILNKTSRIYENVGQTSLDGHDLHQNPVDTFLNDLKDIVTLGAINVSYAQVSKPEWQVNIDWSFNNTDAGGAVNCVWQYIDKGIGQCIVSGGRQCVMQEAQAQAKAIPAKSQGAYNLSLVSQCHNPHAQDTITAAGVNAVASYIQHHQ
jgi:hypothetical protein